MTKPILYDQTYYIMACACLSQNLPGIYMKQFTRFADREWVIMKTVMEIHQIR
jgi:hypothetical protein